MAQEALRIDPARRGALERVAHRRGVSTRDILLRQPGERIKKVWAEALQQRFPGKDFHTRLYRHHGEWILTLCQRV